jgi:HMG-box domain
VYKSVNNYASAKAANDDLSDEACISPPKPARSINKKEVIQLVAEAWRALSSKERAFWDEEARNDKMR